jgi:L-ascorbate metabolism protein UlaG (beta-lactamase superfamily)
MTVTSPSFDASVAVTHIGTATVLLEIDGVTFLTDPVFLPPGPHPQKLLDPQGNPASVDLTITKGPAIPFERLPHIDCVLLSHEDHIDNLDDSGRTLLNGRHVLTTRDGAKNLAPRPAVQGRAPWEKTEITLNGKTFRFTWTPAEHVPGGECTGFIVEYERFGSSGGKPNVLWVSGDTLYTDELRSKLSGYHISIALVNLGDARAPAGPNGSLISVTMSGHDAASFVRDHHPDVTVPVHFEEWEHFAERDAALRESLAKEGVMDKVQFLPRGERVVIA